MSEDWNWKFPCSVEGNYDGDTFHLELDLGFNLSIWKSARLAHVDTPELRGGTDITKALAKLARDRSLEFVRSATEVYFQSAAWSGKYGRPVGDLICDGVSLSAWLIEQGLGLPYEGGRRNQAGQEALAAKAYEQGRLAPYLETTDD